MLQRQTPREQSAGYTPEALNVVFRGGAPQSRPGLRPFHGASFASPIRGLGFHIDADGVPTLLVAAGALIQKCIENGDPETLVMTNLPAGDQTRTEPERVSFLSLSGGLETTFIYDGVNQNLKYDGTRLTKMGFVVAPFPATEGTHGTGTVPAGTRQLKLTLLSEHHEGSANDAFLTVVTTANKKYTVPSPVRGTGANQFDDPQVNKWRLYSTIAGGGTYFFVNEADIGVGIEVNLTDDALGARNSLEQFANNPPPAPATAMTEHRGQLAAVFADDLNLVRFSYMDQNYMVPEGWPEDYVQPVAHGDGDQLKALASMHEWLVCFKEQATYAIAGEAFDEYKVVPVLSAGGGRHIGIGCYAPGTVLAVENAIMFASRDGIYKISRFASAVGGIEAERLSGAIDDLYAAAKFSLGSSCFFDRNNRVFVFLGHG
jgi:hypothetical protein